MSESDDTKPGAVPVTEGATTGPNAQQNSEPDPKGTVNEGTAKKSDEPAAKGVGGPQAVEVDKADGADGADEGGDKAATPGGSRRIAWTFLLVIVVVVFAAGFLSAVSLAPRLVGLLPWAASADVAAGPAPSETIVALETRIAAVEKRNAELGAQISQISERTDRPQPADPSGDIAGLRASDARFGDRLGAVETTLQSTSDGIGKRVVALEQSLASTAAAVARMAAIERRLEMLAEAGNTDALAADLLARLESLETRFRDLSAAPAAAPAAGAGDLDGRLGDLEQRLAALSSARPIDDGSNDRIDRLETILAGVASRIDALNVGQRSQLGRGVALLLAAGALRDATRRYTGYAGELAVLRELATDMAALSQPPVVEALANLDNHAAAGAATVAVLAAQFGAHASAIVLAARRDDDAGWIKQTIDRVSSVVTVRRVGDVGGASVEARVARAELRVAAGDLAAAVAELAGLDGRAAAAAAPWLGKAQTRLAVDAAAQRVYETAARALLAGVPSE